MPRTKLKAVLLDRDGVLNAKAGPHEYIRSPDALILLPNVAKAVAELRRAGLLLMVVTNQRGVSRGQLTEADVEAIHNRLDAELAEEDGAIDRYYYCPHGHADACYCRKPQPGMLLNAMREFGLMETECILVGDSPSDLEAADRAQMSSIFVGDARDAEGYTPIYIAADLADAARYILAHFDTPNQ